MCRPAPEARTAHAKCMLKRHAKGLKGDPRRVEPRIVYPADDPGQQSDRLLPSDIQIINNIEQLVREIRNIDLLFQEPEIDSSGYTSDEEVCQRYVPVHDMDLSDPEGFMSEDSGSD